MANYENDIKQAVEVLKRGGVILYPTDTIWGIGCDATNSEAVRRVFEIKRRIDSKALTVLVDSTNRLQRYVSRVPDVAWDMIDASLGIDPKTGFRDPDAVATRPLTVILDGAVNLAPEVIAEDGSVGIRVTQEAFSNQLCYRFQRPIVSTSANISGESTPLQFSQIAPELLAAVDYVCTSRRAEKAQGKPSQIIKLTQEGCVKIIRS